MNINLNTIHQAGIPAQLPEVGTSEQKQPVGKAPALSITRAVASAKEIEGAEIPELKRDDTLGQFVNSVFNLHPPPFPQLPPD